ncbi:XRE family transcriptional regulator [Chryseobacterium carnipullorum]|uniref:Helix-turn-helix n=1 Tax=Chryseobacterium carnipullorum TaxID=1124835 RepID=A0A376DTZ9_CHRCU|nr:helix-turn-helix transcriptional regulator [Chryseobacterium carnipullorum]AZA49543.1 XRE family transcriptional regulator [Chryseobacterium carnipullorum]STC94769.1 Helix-turn-helix [Chryseobacterium carnipullorum]
MTISEKIYHYLRINDLQVKDLAEKLDINRVTLSAMLNGRNRFSQDFFEALNENCPEIDLNALVNKNVDVDFLNEEGPKNPDSERIKELEKSLKEIKKILNKTKI